MTRGERKPEDEPGFWPSYTPPATAVLALAQMPSYRIDGYSLSNSVMKDWRANRKANRATLKSLEARE